MPRTTRSAATLEAKALAASSKSEGMRMLYDAGKTVAEVTKIMGVPYGFAYGVAQRAGKAETAAKRRAPRKATQSKPATKKVATVAKKATATKPATSTRNIVRPLSAVARTASKLAARPAAKPGRPTAERRAVNRKTKAEAVSA